MKYIMIVLEVFFWVFYAVEIGRFSCNFFAYVHPKYSLSTEGVTEMGKYFGYMIVSTLIAVVYL